MPELLAPQLIDAGSQLIERLDAEGVEVRSAFWLFDAEADDWRLVLSMPLVDEAGVQAALRAIKKVLVPGGPLHPLYLRQVAPVSPKDETVRRLSQAVKTGREISGIRFGSNALGNLFIDDAYIYRST